MPTSKKLIICNQSQPSFGNAGINAAVVFVSYSITADPKNYHRLFVNISIKYKRPFSFCQLTMYQLDSAVLDAHCLSNVLKSFTTLIDPSGRNVKIEKLPNTKISRIKNS